MNNGLHLLKDGLGWVAMAAFAASYLCRSAASLRRAQAGAAAVWVAYGLTTGALPVVVSNAVVAFMAVVYPWIKARWGAPDASGSGGDAPGRTPI